MSKAASFPDSAKDVEIMMLGNKRLILLAAESKDSGFDGPIVTEHFLTERDQPVEQLHEDL